MEGKIGQLKEWKRSMKGRAFIENKKLENIQVKENECNICQKVAHEALHFAL